MRSGSSRETCTWLTTLLLFFMTTSLIVGSVRAQEHHEALAKNYLNRMLEHLESNISLEGVARGYEGDSTVKATARLGLLAGYVHMGLKDSDSLTMLNKISKALNSLLERPDEPASEQDKLLMRLAVLEFASMHYGLTRSESSQKLLTGSCKYLVEKFGWSPATSCSTYILYSEHVAHIAGGRVDKGNVEYALNEIHDHYIDFINYSSRGGTNLAYGLNILSIGIKLALVSGAKSPVEVAAMWQVHLNYSINYLKESYEKLSPDEAEAFLNGLISALETGLEEPLNAEAISISEKIASGLLENWAAGGRIILQKRPSLSYLPYDPSLDFSSIASLAQNYPAVRVHDLDLPILLKRLSKINGVRGADRYGEAISLAVESVATSKPYFRVLGDEMMPHQDLVDRILSARFIALWLAFERAETARPAELELAFSGPSYYTLIGCSAILIGLLALHRMGKLFGSED